MLSPMSANTVATHREEEPSESLEEIEAQTIGNLLPDEDDLFAEVIGEVGRKSRANGDDLDDFDLFSSVGGMELDGDVFSSVGHRNGERGGNNSFGEHHRGEIPSRTILAGNISSNVEDYELKVLFEVPSSSSVFGSRGFHLGKTWHVEILESLRTDDKFTCSAIWRHPGSQCSLQESWLYLGIVL